MGKTGFSTVIHFVLGKTQIFGVGRAQVPAVMYSVGKTLISSVSRAQLSSVTMSKRQLVFL